MTVATPEEADAIYKEASTFIRENGMYGSVKSVATMAVAEYIASTRGVSMREENNT